MAGPRFGRFGEVALWVLVVLADGPQPVVRLVDEVRRRNGHVGPGTFFGAIARLERASLIEATTLRADERAYRLHRSPDIGVR